MQRCGSSHGNTIGPCPSNGRLPPSTLSMLFSVPLDHDSAVDCTLSLGTPSTRDVEKRAQNRTTSVTNFCWDLLHVPFQPPLTFLESSYKSGHGSGNGDGGDPLLARRCANCDTTSTPLWRNGPRGPKSLCNACGIRFKKEERRAAGATGTDASRAAPAAMGQPITWAPHPQPNKIPCLSPGIRGDSGAGISFLSWRLNVADRPSLRS